ncbi:MAG TPA: hypothetical protein VH277_08300 [Gemmatimonadaceae bacterium]|jgi:hypothetical protein|nr:hypothetical protein [Gemmatimonadaceae bacterium]
MSQNEKDAAVRSTADGVVIRRLFHPVVLVSVATLVMMWASLASG